MNAKGYRHLTPEERDCIAVLLAEGLSLGEIGNRLGRDKSSISREVRRNGPQGRRGAYFSHSAQDRSSARWEASHKKERLKNVAVREYVEAKIALGWSPELVAGRIGLESPGLSVSHEAIYQYIYTTARRLIRHLARGGWSGNGAVTAGNMGGLIYRRGWISARVPMQWPCARSLGIGRLTLWSLDVSASQRSTC